MNNKVKKIIEERLGLSPDSYTEDSDFVTDLGFDSLDVMDLTMEIEKEYDIFIPDDVFDKLTTPRKLSDYVDKFVK